MERQELPWEKVAFFICEKCGKCIDLPSSERDDLADNLKSYYRTQLKKEDMHKDVRVMVSGCLNVCEKGVQAAALFDKATHESFVLTFDVEKDKEKVLQMLKNRVR